MIRSTLTAMALIGLVAGTASARDFTAVQTIERMIPTTQTDGTVTIEFQPADRVTPGDALYYSISYDNDTGQPVENIELVMIVPPEVVYAENSTQADFADLSVAFSTDNGESFAPRGELKITQAGESRPAVSEEITHIRWTFDGVVAAGEQGTVGFQAVVR